MSKALIDKLRKAREIVVEAEGHKFTVRRPTDAEVVQMPGASAVEFVRRFVVGWDLRELDVIPGGGPEAVTFEADLWGEWIADKASLWDPLATAMLDAYKTHAEAREAAGKNS